MCYLCSSDDYSLIEKQSDLRFFPDDEFQIVRCNTCGLQYTLPKLTIEELGKYYPPNYGAYTDDVTELIKSYDPDKTQIAPNILRYGQDLYIEIMQKFPHNLASRISNQLRRLKYMSRGYQRARAISDLLPINNRPGNYLHIGSGTGGTFIKRLKEGWDVSVIDVNNDLMDEWSARLPITAYGDGIKREHFDENSFDVIFMSHVIEHLTDPLNDLSILREWLKPDGILVCELPIYNTFGWEKDRKYVYYDVPRHTMHFTTDTLAQMLNKAGLILNKSIVVPYSYGFYFSDFKKFHLEGTPQDSSTPNGVSRPRHIRLGYLGWLLQSSGNNIIYAVKG